MADSEWIVGPEEGGVRADKYVAGAGGLGSRAKALAGVERGKVCLNGDEAGVANAATRLAAGQIVRVWMDRPGSSRARRSIAQIGQLAVIYEDEALLVVDKPAGLLSVPLERKADAPSVYEQIEDHFRPFGKRRPFVVHRIDQDTSGLVVFAKDARTQSRLKAQFKRREPRRIYLAVVYGHPEPQAGTWRNHLVWDDQALIQKETHPRDRDAAEAVRDYRVLESFRDTSLIEVRLQSARRNQIRIQARLRGHTLVGEKRYTYGPDALRTIQFDRHALHAYRLGFDHPDDGRPLELEAPPPADFVALLRRLRRR